jgi:hypothetical protein
MDRYTKFVLTVIAVGIIGLNIHFFKEVVVTSAHANVPATYMVVKQNNSLLHQLINMH